MQSTTTLQRPSLPSLLVLIQMYGVALLCAFSLPALVLGRPLPLPRNLLGSVFVGLVVVGSTGTYLKRRRQGVSRARAAYAYLVPLMIAAAIIFVL